MFKSKSDIEFKNWMLELNGRLLRFQLDMMVDKTQIDYIKHRNCVSYDRDIRKLRASGNSCTVCNLPLPAELINCYEIYKVGTVCDLCYAMHTVMTSSIYFCGVQREERERHGRRRDDGRSTTS